MKLATRTFVLLTIAFASVVFATTALAQTKFDHLPERGIFSEAPAKIWQEAMLSGNGTMGAMVFGDPNDERIILNHERLYEPLLDEPCPVPNAAGALKKTRELYLAGKYKEGYLHYFNACKQAGFPGIQWTDPYHPACALTITGSKSTANDYSRSTNFRNGEVLVRWGNGQYRQTFVSRPNEMIVHRIISTDENNASNSSPAIIQLINQDARDKSRRVDKFGGGYQDPVVDTEDGWITYRCKYDRSKRGYVVVLRAITNGQPTPISSKNQNTLSATSGDTLLLIDIRSLEDYANVNTAIAEMKQKLNGVEPRYGTLLKQHEAIHREMFERVQFSIGVSNQQKATPVSTDQLIAAQQATVETDLNPIMLQKMFEMGRYTLISSSGEWPPNLMGIWNGDWRPKWSGDFTLDANVNLQIAAANIGNLPEAMASYDRLIQGLVPDWRTNAMNLYGCRGVLSDCRTAGRNNLHTHYSEGFPGSSWVSGAQWLVLPMFEHYQTTGDKKYLQEKLLPLMKEIALFYEDYLATTEGKNGTKIFVPSYSPENKPTGADHSSVVNATMDIACCKEVLTQLLGLQADTGLSDDERQRYQKLQEKSSLDT